MPPAGFRRSRALWDEARRPRGEGKKLDEWRALFRAVLYEIQPIRFNDYTISLSVLLSFGKTWVIPTVRRTVVFCCYTLLPGLWSALCGMTLRHWMIVGGIVLYYCVLRWVHELLDAGPLMVIVTALAAIFTVGLGDNADGELSAYSVFNRGFQQLLGSINVEDLVNQHVGGGMMMVAAGRLPPAAEAPNDNHRRHPRNGPINNIHPRDPRNHFPDQGEGDDYDAQEDELDNEQQQQQQHHRRAGKKSRRRNLEERQEQRRQREIVRAMGLDGTGGDQEMMAMQRLIEEQIANNNNNNNQD